MLKKCLIFLLLPLFLSFNRNEKLKVERSDSTFISNEYTQIEIYCWCFNKITTSKSSPVLYMSTCTTWQPVKPEDLMKAKYLLTTITKQQQIKKLITILQKGQAGNVKDRVVEDSRVAILLKMKSGDNVFFHTNTGGSLYKNSTVEVRFSFNIIEAIEKAAGIKIKCSSNN